MSGKFLIEICPLSKSFFLQINYILPKCCTFVIELSMLGLFTCILKSLWTRVESFFVSAIGLCILYRKQALWTKLFVTLLLTLVSIVLTRGVLVKFHLGKILFKDPKPTTTIPYVVDI